MPRVILPPSRVIFSRLFLLFVFFFFLFEQPFGDVEKIEFPVSPSDGIDRFFFFFVVFFFFRRRRRGRGGKKVTDAAEKRSLSLLAKKPRLFSSSLLSCVLRQPSKNWKNFARRHFCAEENCLFANRNNTKRDEVPHPLRESLNSETSSAVFRNFLCIFLPFGDPMYLHPLLVGHQNTR